MLKAIADRLAEALTEYMHEKLEIKFGAMLLMNNLIMRLIAEKYQEVDGSGYTACP